MESGPPFRFQGESCLIIQPIHAAGTEALAGLGLEARMASASDMATVAREARDCIAVITRNAGFSAAAIGACPKLKVIGVHGTGTDPVDIGAATARGVAVVNTPDANVRSVAEQAIALLLALAKAVPAADRAAREGDFAFRYRTRLIELADLTLGVLGFGRIGQATARLARALGMRVVGYSSSRPDNEFAAVGAERVCGLDALLSKADVLSVHLPLTARTRNLIGKHELARMKPGSFLINTSRGAVVDEEALVGALASGHLGGAGLDVYASEEMPRDHPLLRAGNVVLSPHVGGSTEAALERAAIGVVAEIGDVLDGRRPAHLVNPDMWERRRSDG